MAHLKIGNPSKGAVSAACLKQLLGVWGLYLLISLVKFQNHLEVSPKWRIPFIAAWFVMEHAGTMDDLGVPPFQETSTCWW